MSLFYHQGSRLPVSAALMLVLLLSCLPAAWGQAARERRIALVIGNGAYEHASVLLNPPRDAQAMAATLRTLGFEVLVELDLDHGGLRRALANFAGQLEGAQVGLLFYAGHGLQVHGRNYLVPIEAKLEREADLYLQVLAMDDVLRIMETTVPTRLVFLDACRDNPLARSLARTIGTARSDAVGEGLARMEAAVGTLIAYATAPEHVAFDGTGDNSPFTAALVEHIRAPNLEVRQVLTRVRSSVIAATENRQVPWDSSSLTSDFYFNLANIGLQSQEGQSPAPGWDRESIFWQSIQASEDPADFEAYLQQFPQGTYAALARNRQARLQRTQQAAVPPAIAVAPREALEPPVTLVEPMRAEAVLQLAREDWLGLQEALTVLGLRAGVGDGYPGLNTREAIAAWQQGRGEEATGFFTGAQREALLAEAATVLAALESEQADRPGAMTGSLSSGTVFRDCADCPELVVVPAGSFIMGSPEREPARLETEGPSQLVTFPQPVALGRYEVTRGEFRKFVEETGDAPPETCRTYFPPTIDGGRHDWQAAAGVGWENPGFAQTDAHPVVCISWTEAQAFASWLSRRTGEMYRLPSEAEWEYAARATSPGRAYWPDSDQACTYSNLYDRSGDQNNEFDWRSSAGCDDGYAQTAPVGSFLANQFGLYDMLGNVSEWVADCWMPSLQGLPSDGSARVAEAGCDRRVRRGGSWVNNPGGPNARSASRNAASDGFRAIYQGFRVARDLP